jgi:hypothetical protein
MHVDWLDWIEVLYRDEHVSFYNEVRANLCSDHWKERRGRKDYDCFLLPT